MLKSVEKLAKGLATRVGNHSVEVDWQGISHFKYHGNEICTVYHNLRNFELHHCGFSSSSSTTRALNSYEKCFKDAGYVLIYRGE